MLTRLADVKALYERLAPGKSDLLRLLDESEIPEGVYNSNAIENSTLTLEETERILLAVEMSRHMDLHEVHEAQNLARVTAYIRSTSSDELGLDRLRWLHRMLMSNIDESIAGRFRAPGEYVRVGTHIAPASEQIEQLLTDLFSTFAGAVLERPTQRLARLHLEFERIHPFNDGNGRIGRVLLNDALFRLGFPPVIIRNKSKMDYYSYLRTYDSTGAIKQFEDYLLRIVLESLHRRCAYLNGDSIRPVVDVARESNTPTNALLNQARRQVIPAFRERGIWKIGVGRSSK